MIVSNLALGAAFEEYENTSSAYDLIHEPERDRNDFFPPIYSFFLPGLDQWIEAQYGHAAVYTGIGVASLSLASSFSNRQIESAGILTRDNDTRFYRLGVQTYSTAGALSLYHSFRTAVRTKQPARYAYLGREEGPGELALSAFRFDYLLRPTTFVPLILLGGLIAVAGETSQNHWVRISGYDAFFMGATSYNAGLWEELIFRGYVTQFTEERIGSPMVTHLSVASLFALAHLSQDNKFPIFQFLTGAYFGWLSQHNDWTLSEGIFLHTWWDVVAIGAAYAYGEQNIYLPLPTVALVF